MAEGLQAEFAELREGATGDDLELHLYRARTIAMCKLSRLSPTILMDQLTISRLLQLLACFDLEEMQNILEKSSNRYRPYRRSSLMYAQITTNPLVPDSCCYSSIARRRQLRFDT